jgi:hypothetical protein
VTSVAAAASRPLGPAAAEASAPSFTLLLKTASALRGGHEKQNKVRGLTCRSPRLRKGINLVRVTMLQASPHGIHFKRI